MQPAEEGEHKLKLVPVDETGITSGSPKHATPRRKPPRDSRLAQQQQRLQHLRQAAAAAPAHLQGRDRAPWTLPFRRVGTEAG